MECIYSTEIKELGPEASEFLETGVVDVVAIESQESRVTAIGGKAWQNSWEPGYAVFKFTGGEEVEPPGETYLKGSGSKKLGEIVRPGTQVEIKAASS